MLTSAKRATKVVRTYAPPLARAFRASFDLRPVVNRTASIRPTEIILVGCQRNEYPRLPYFFDYYRRLGVGHFLFVDNDSDDESREWLARQADCSLWHTKASYRASNFGMQWCNALLARYGSGRWCLTVDPDEFLVYPHMATRSLRALCQFLDDEKRRSFHTVMLDAYSDKALSQTVYGPGDDPFEVCPYFDRDGYHQQEGWGRSTCIQGGPRMRTYFADRPAEAPALNKTPLVKWRRHYVYRSSMHDLRPFHLNNAQKDNPHPTTGCLFHFKFMASLTEKAAEEMRRKQHYDNSAEYKRYNAAGDINFYREGLSVRYESDRQLVELGLMSPGRWF
jgi:hypothetical protein